MLTKAILETLSSQAGHWGTDMDITEIERPNLSGDTLILRVSAFASEQDHPRSRERSNDEKLLGLHFRGFFTWKSEHGEHYAGTQG